MAAETYRICIKTEVEDDTGPGFESAKKKVSAFDKVVQQTQGRLKNLTGSRWDAVVSLKDKATSVLSTVESKIKSAAGKAWNIAVGIKDTFTAPFQGILNLLKNPLVQAGAAIGVSISAKDVIDTFSGFESTMSKVQSLIQFSSKDLVADMDAISAKAKELGASTKFTAQEAGEAFTYMAMAGWDTEKMLKGIDGIMALSAADGLDLATTSDIVTDAMTALGMAADESGHFADVLAKAGASANTNVSLLGESFKYIGTMAGTLGYSAEDVSIALGLMANNEIKGSMAGTSLNSVMTRLATNTSGARDELENLGVAFYDSNGNANDLMSVMVGLRKATRGMSDQQKISIANTIAGMEAQKGLLGILNTTEEEFEKLTQSVYECDGAAEAMAGTMLDNLQGSMTLLSSAVDGVKMSLGSRLSPYLRQFVDWLTTKMPDVEAAVNRVMDVVDEKVAQLKGTIAEFTSSDEWANADIWGKIAIAWDKIVAEPFSQWWESSGKPWLTEKVAAFGETLGSGITAGLLALLGFDASGAVADGVTIGKSFFEGFKSGLDMDKISEAFTEWASDHKGIVAAAGVVAGGKLLGGIAKAFQSGKSLFGGLLGGSGNGGGVGLGSFVSTMTVSAGTVIVNGSMSSGAANAVRNVAQGATGTGGTLALPGAAGAAGNAGRLALPGASEAGRLALPGPAGGAAATGGLTSAGSWLSKLLTMGSSSSVVGADGTLLAVQGGVGGTLGSVAGTLGSGATTAAGAAAVGAGSIAGAAGGILGLGSAAIDLFQGFTKQKEGDAKGAQDEFVTAGTKTGMVGAGAAAGAGIGAFFGGVGAVPGALIGAGVGGLGALLGGDGIGKMLSDALDEGGALNNIWQTIKTGAGDAWESVKAGAASVGGFVSEKWDAVKEGAASIGAAVSDKWNQASEAVSAKWGELSSWFGENVWTPISDLGISAINIAAGAWISIAEPIQQKWGELTGWFNDNVWEPVKEKAQEAGQWISDRWAEAKDWVSETWSSFCGWFDENVYGPVKEGAQAAATWIGERWSDAKTAVSEAWQAFSGWFDENVWSPIKEGARAAGEWIGTKWTEAKTLVSDAWQSFSGWFDETVWTPVKEGAQAAGEWIGSKISDAKTAIQTAWEGVSGWFSENVWSPIKEGAQAAGEWIGEKMAAAKNAIQGAWQDAKDFVAGLGDKGSQATGLTTSQGQSTVLAHASGGIMTQPHMGLVAEDGPEAIIPLGASSRSRGMAVWEEAGDILGANSAAPVGSNDDGFGGGTKAPVGSNDNGLGDIAPAPVGSNDNGLRDIAQEGNAGGHSGPQGGGNGEDVPVYSSETPGRTGPAEASQDAPVNVPVNITINPEFVIQAAQGGMSADDIVALLKEHIRAMVDDISDEMAEKLARIFANMPVRGGA